MLFATVPQPWVFLYTLYGGVILGAFYDILRLLRRLLHSKPWLDAVFDGIFWLVGTGFIFAVLLYLCQGEVRWYCLAGFLLGSVFYMLGMSKLLWAAGRAVSGAIKKVAACLAATKLACIVRR